MKQDTLRQRKPIARVFVGPKCYYVVSLGKRGRALLCSCRGATSWTPQDSEQTLLTSACAHLIALCCGRFPARHKHEARPGHLFVEMTEYGKSLFHWRWVEQAIKENG